MNKWWKSPVLQGPENDYGDYDYLIEELPQDYAKWELSKYKSRCDSCGKNSHLLFRAVHHFYTLDGYDSMSYDECWKCKLEAKIYNIKVRLKKRLKIVIDTIDLCSINPYGWKSVKRYYQFAKAFNNTKLMEVYYDKNRNRNRTTYRG